MKRPHLQRDSQPQVWFSVRAPPVGEEMNSAEERKRKIEDLIFIVFSSTRVKSLLTASYNCFKHIFSPLHIMQANIDNRYRSNTGQETNNGFFWELI